jgi:hypothetical protein
MDISLIATATHMRRSILLNVLKTELLEDTEAYYVYREGVAKEFNASQVIVKTALEYRCLDLEQFSTSAIRYCHCSLMTVEQRIYARKFVENIISLLDAQKTRIWYPHVQRKKSVSITTAKNLYDAGYRGDGRNYRNFRTLDLELAKVWSGIEVQGENEMRAAWKFNELKPRIYYAIGGTSYWKCRYMKPFAVMLMEAGDNTMLSHRVDPERLNLELLLERDYLAIWDLESMTTKLAEAKFFLYWIARQIKDSHLEATPFKFLDYAEGIVHKSIGDYLLEFNEEENNESKFLFGRMLEKIDALSEEEGEDFVLEQRNNGMLGSMGNIGVATAFHGFHTAMGVKRCIGCSVCIGDDAAALLTVDPKNKKKGIVKHIQEIGVLNEDKVYVFEPMYEDDYDVDTWKFLKRGLQRGPNGIFLDFFEVLPNFLYISGLDNMDYTHTLSQKTLFEHKVAFVSSVGALLWSINTHGMVEDEDIELLRKMLTRSYLKMCIPLNGRLPYQVTDTKSGRVYPIAIPPVDFQNFDVVKEDWAEIVWDRRLGTWFKCPVDQGLTELPPFTPGLEFIASGSKLTSILEDLDCIEVLGDQFEWVQSSEGNRRRFFHLLAGRQHKVTAFKYKDHAPSWIHELYSLRAPTFTLEATL